MAGSDNKLNRARLRPLPKPLPTPCPKCGDLLLERFGLLGKYVSCINHPKCTYTTGGKFRPVRLTRKG